MESELFFLLAFFISFALALDAFSVALCVGAFLQRTTFREKFRLSFHFGLFQFIMPLVGWFLGEQVIGFIQYYDHWVAFGILTAIGLKMIIESIQKEPKKISQDITKGWKLVSLSTATSLDALAVGFTISLFKMEIFVLALIIGLVAGLMTLVGIYLGERLSRPFGKLANSIAGIVLILIGSHILLNHLGVV
ncbi:MAG: manganese efflux pump MntP family protein [Ignavibacteria bacterium]|nr:manganese efflux pump MntP family protein [Ignavibacteria bacterium]